MTTPLSDAQSLRGFLKDCFRCARNRVDVKAFDYASMKTQVEKENIVKHQIDTDISSRPIESVVESIGKTPLIRLSRISAKYNIKCNLYGKFEAVSGSGSVKDRIAREMISIAEAAGTIKPGDIIIEATSGNTGVGLATVCAVKGYPLVIFMPEKMSKEKERTMVALGAFVFRTRTSAMWHEEDSHISFAQKMETEINSRTAETGRRALFVDQYKNTGNVSAHYHGTAEEILKQLDNKLDALVVGCGTGGTITGLATRIKEVVPECKICGVDPLGSLLHVEAEKLKPQDASHYEVEGIGYDFHPSTFQPNLVDEWLIEDDQSAFDCARALIRYEGLLVGGSSGTALSAAIKVAQKMREGQNVAVIFPDSVRNYITKFLSDDWMVVHGFLPPSSHPLADSTAPFKTLTIKEATASLALLPYSNLSRFSDSLTVRETYPQTQSGLYYLTYDQHTSRVTGLFTKADLIPHVLDDKLDKPLSSVAAPQTLLIMSEESSLRDVWVVMDAACEARKTCSPVIVLSRKTRPGTNLRVALQEFKEAEDQESVMLTQDQLAGVILDARK